MNSVDVVIAGGGIVGTTLALALSHTPLRIIIVEPTNPAPWQSHCIDNRVFAITRASQRIFTALEVWEGIFQRRVSPFREMFVWDAMGDGSIHFDSAEIGIDALGHIIEQSAMQAALNDRLSSCTTISRVAGAVTDVLVGKDNAVVNLGDGTCISTKLVVGADGASSHIRRIGRIQGYGWPYDQTAIVAAVQTELPHRETAWQRFLPSGPLAFLPLSNEESSIVWSVTHDRAQALLQLDDASFCQELTTAFGNKLGSILKTSARAAFPLRMYQVTDYAKTRLALVGDAAHIIHPLAGQGVNLGLLDAAALAEVIFDAYQSRKDIGALDVLRRYERWRKGDNTVSMFTMDAFKRVFGTQWSLLRALRNKGLQVTNSLTPAKNLIMRMATGDLGDLPQLARGNILKVSVNQYR